MESHLKNKLDVNTLKLLIPYFNYLFIDIEWDYNKLTSKEKLILPEYLFIQLKTLYNELYN